MPRRSIQQREFGNKIEFNELTAGDLVFVSGRFDYYYNNPMDGVGHVGIVTYDGTIIHASGKRFNVVKTPLEKFIGKDKFRGARRYVSKDTEVFTLEIPVNQEIETADDIRWIILKSL